MGYFNLSCFEQKNAKTMLLAFHIILLILGCAHGAYVGNMGYLLSLYQNDAMYASSLKTSEAQMQSPMAFYAIMGIVQVIFSVIMILIVIQVIGKQNKLTWIKVIIFILISQLALNFFIATYSSMLCLYHNQIYKVYLEATETVINAYTDAQKEIHVVTLSFVQFTKAEAIVTWLLAVPFIVMTFIGLCASFLNQSNIGLGTQLGNITITVQNKQHNKTQGILN